MRLLQLDTAQHDRKHAIASYDALRGEGFAADPLLRHRLSLAMAFPTAPWHARDAGGLAALLALLLVQCLLPLLWILPIHYAALVRPARVADATAARWSLRHLWGVSAAMLSTQLLTMYLFTYDRLHDILVGQAGVADGQLDLARYFVAVVIGGSLSVLPWLRAGDYGRIVRASWGPMRVLVMVGASLLAVIVIQALCSGIAYALHMSGKNDSLTPASVGLTSIELVRATARVYGPWMVFPLVAFVVPVYEEIAFRSVFLGSAARVLPFAWANVLQAGLFAAAHGEVVHAPGLVALGLLTGWLARRSGGLLPAIGLHASMNLLASWAICFGPGCVAHGINDAGQASERAARTAHAARVETAMQQYRKGCDAGDAEDCSDLGWCYEAGQGAKTDLGQAAHLYAKACDHDSAFGCNSLCTLYRDGHGTRRDAALAAALCSKACDLGSVHAIGRTSTASVEGLRAASSASP